MPLIYKAPRLYDWSLRHLHGPDLTRRFERIAEVIGARRVLDVACGTGMLADYLHEGASYAGIDLNERFLRHARRKGLDVLRQDIHAVERYPEADCYVICDLLHHILPRHERLLERVLALGKTVVVCEPFLPSKSKLRRFLMRAVLDYDFINPPRLDLDWYTEVELVRFYQDRVRPSEIVKIGQDLLAIRHAPAL